MGGGSTSESEAMEIPSRLEAGNPDRKGYSGVGEEEITEEAVSW